MVDTKADITALVDTSVVIDLLRQHPPAQTWYANETNLGISALVWVEILNGVQDKAVQSRATRQLRLFQRIDLTPADFDWAIMQQAKFKLSHYIGGIDCLIATPCHQLNMPHYTLNLKHFTLILGSFAQKPY